MENKIYLKVVSSAIYLANGDAICKTIFNDDSDICCNSNDEAMRYIKDENCLSKNQKIALFAYLYLYSRLQKKEMNNLNLIKNSLGITNGIEKNVSFIINTERIEYIIKSFHQCNRNYLEIFQNPDNFIINMIEDVVASPIQEDKQKLCDLKASEYEHPTDKIALEILKSNPSLKTAMTFFNDYTIERMMTVLYTGSSFMVTNKNIPYLFQALEETCKILDVTNIPKIYVAGMGLNACTIGTKSPIIVVGSACLSLLTYDELLFILGHEIGHIKSGHFLYHSMARLLPMLGKITGNFTLGIGEVLSTAIQIPLMEWYRKSELTADRAGLLACQNPDAAYTLLTKLSGYPMKYYNSIDKNDILQQARDFEDLDSSSYNKVAKVMNILYAEHPWTIMRAKELDTWINSGKYNTILKTKKSGEYNPYSNVSSSIKITFK